MKSLRLLAVGLVMISAMSAMATLEQVSVRADLPPTDAIQWGQFGPDATLVAPNSIGATDNGDLFQVFSQTGNLIRADQGGILWPGSFNPGEELIGTDGLDVGIILNQGVQGIGANIEMGAYGNFTAEMDVYDLGLNYVGSEFVDGTTTPAADGSAPFLGVRSDQADIGAVVFSLYAYDVTPTFAIDKVSLSSVPEPASMAVLAVGALGLLRRRRAK